MAVHDGAEIARRFGPQPGWIDELVAAVTRLQGVHLVDITVDQNRGPIVVGKATTIHAIQRVRHSGRRTRSPRLLPEFWQPIGVLLSQLRAGGKVNVGTDRTPQANRRFAQQVVAACRVGHDVVHRSPKALQQKGLSTHVFTQQLGASLSVRQAQHHGLLPDVPTWHTDLENRRSSVNKRRLDDQGGVTAREAGPDHQRPLLGQRVDHAWQLVQPGFVPVGHDRLADLVRNVEAHTASLNRANTSVVWAACRPRGRRRAARG